MKVVLASASPRRANLLNQAGIHFQVDPSSVDESIVDSRPASLVIKLSKKKAEEVANRHPNSFVIAADTIVCLKGEILGKPINDLQAAEYLRRLSNNTHEVYSGVYAGLTNASGLITSDLFFSERTKVTFSALSELEIKQYIKHEQPFDKAGSYGIQDDLGALFIKKIDGDYNNVVGFPLHRFYNNLRKEIPDIHKQLFSHLHEI